MFYSKKYNLLVIGIPKTGTISVEEALQKFDPSGETHSISMHGIKLKGGQFAQGILGHARAKEIRDVIGAGEYDMLNTITFIRDPKEKLVSAYAFNKKNSILGFLQMKGKKKRLLRQVKALGSMVIAKILPFQLWALVYPYRSSYGYIFDDQGKKLVKYIGRTEHLESDLNDILKNQIGIQMDDIKLKHLNKSDHKNSNEYFKNRLFAYLVSKRIQKDVDLYECINSQRQVQDR